MSTPSSHILRTLLPPSLFTVAYIALLAVYDGLRLAAWPSLPPLSLGPLGLSSSVLSLLLVFRTNTSYQRFDEARRLWGGLVNRCRDLVRLCLVYFTPQQARLVPAVAKWVTALAHCARLHQRAPREATPLALARLLSPAELAGLAAATHRPNYCLQVLARLVAKGCPDSSVAYRLDEDLKYLEDTIGGFERLYRTPIPLSYTRHTSRLLLLWLVYAPAALFSTLGLQALLAAPMLVLALFGIDEIGVELEEPMAILPLEALCDAVQEQVEELLAIDAGAAALAASYGAA